MKNQLSPIANPGNYINSIQGVMILLLAGSFVAAFYPVWKELVQTWLNSEDYSHGFFIIPICFYFIWQKKEIFKEVSRNNSQKGIIWVALSLFVYLAVYFGEILTLASLSMLVVLAGAVVYLWNFVVLKRLAFIFLLMLFMIPVPEQIYSAMTIHLQLFVTKISVAIATHLGVPIYQEGNVINIPNQTLQVVKACSGIRSLMTLLTLSAVLGYVTLKSNFLRGLLLISALPTAIIVNVVRVLIMVVVFYYFNYDLADEKVHNLYGLFIFFLSLGLLLVVNKILARMDRSMAVSD